MVVAVTSLALALPLYIKNQALFGVFGASSISGCNLYRIASAPEADPAASAELPPLLAVDAYPAPINPGKSRGGPELADVYKEYPGERYTNLNNLNMIDVCRHYGGLARAVAMRNPRGTLENIVASWILYWNPSSQHFSLRPRHGSLGWSLRVYEDVLHSGVPVADLGFLERKWKRLEPVLISRRPKLTIPFFAFPIGVLALSLSIGREALRATRASEVLSRYRRWLPLAALVAYSMAVSVLFELGENARFKFDIEPLLWIAACAVLSSGVGRLLPAWRVRKAALEVEGD